MALNEDGLEVGHPVDWETIKRVEHERKYGKPSEFDINTANKPDILAKLIEIGANEDEVKGLNKDKLIELYHSMQ